MIAVVQAGAMSGAVKIPSSKSIAQRALAAALVRKGKSIINGISWSNDEKAALHIIQQSGCETEVNNDQVIVRSNGIHFKTTQINCGESGLSARLFLPLLATSTNSFSIVGEGTLVQRPFDSFTSFLPQLGVQIALNNGRLPAYIQGPLQARSIHIDGSLSSQFLTGLLFAYSSINPHANIQVAALKSKFYIDLTIDVLKAFSLPIPENLGYEAFVFHQQKIIAPNEITFDIEADWSSASCMLVAAALTGSVSASGLSEESLQPDIGILNVFSQCGVPYHFGASGLEVQQGSMLRSFNYDATDSPDLFPGLVALATQCHGISRIAGVERLIFKESNRAASITAMLQALGVSFAIDDDAFVLEGPCVIGSAVVDSFNDHRIAMSAAVFGAVSRGGVSIKNAESVSKSYPQFFTHLNQLGIPVSLNSNL